MEAGGDVFECEEIVSSAMHGWRSQDVLKGLQQFTGSLDQPIVEVNVKARPVAIRHVHLGGKNQNVFQHGNTYTCMYITNLKEFKLGRISFINQTITVIWNQNVWSISWNDIHFKVCFARKWNFCSVNCDKRVSKAV